MGTHNKLGDKTCPICGKVFHPQRNKNKYCSTDCYKKAREQKLGRSEAVCRKHFPDCKYLRRDDYFGLYCAFDLIHPEIDGGAVVVKNKCNRYEKLERASRWVLNGKTMQK